MTILYEYTAGSAPLDKSKVMIGLKQCSTHWDEEWDSPEDCPCNRCPYRGRGCVKVLASDAQKVIVAYERALVPLNVEVKLDG